MPFEEHALSVILRGAFVVMSQSAVRSSTGTVRGMAYRPAGGAAMMEVQHGRAAAAGWLEGDPHKSPRRGLTLLSAESWAEVCHELGVTLPWYTRRANLLIEGIDLPSTIGREITIGDVRLRIHAETRPCGVMDQAHQGLKNTLAQHGRGGVYGEVLRGGDIRVGDCVRLEPADGPP